MSYWAKILHTTLFLMAMQFSKVWNGRFREAKGQKALKYVKISKIGQISEGKNVFPEKIYITYNFYF